MRTTQILTAIGFVVVTSSAQAEPLKLRQFVEYTAAATFQTTDVATLKDAQARGCHEANPTMRDASAARVAGQKLLLVVPGLVASAVFDRLGHPKAASTLRWFAAGAGAVGTIANMKCDGGR